MPIRGPLIAPGLRLKIGASILAAAGAVDTRAVKRRLARFTCEHRRYVEAQRKVAALELKLRAEQARLSRCDADQRRAAVRLYGALIGEGRWSRNPFAAFGAPSPSKMARLPFADEAEAVHRLVATIRLQKPIRRRTLEVTRAADDAARAVEQAIVRVAKAEASVRDMRRQRDTIGRGWHDAFVALKWDARAAADDGAPMLHAVLFPAPARGVRRKKKRPAECSGPSTMSRQTADGPPGDDRAR